MTNQQNNFDDNESASKEAFVTASGNNDEASNWKKSASKTQRKEKIKKILLTIFIVICSLIIVLVSTLFVLNRIGLSNLLDNSPDIDPNTNDDAIIYNDGTLLYNDVLYEYNKNVTAILFMGVDREKLVESDSHGTNGQADTLMLVTVDTENGKTTVTAIPRDTITNINIYSSSGDFLMTEKKQLCLAYAYGDGKTLSCENTVEAVCELMLGMPINTYLSSDYSLISKLCDTLGGINVTPNETFEASRAHYATKYKFEKGTTYKLDSITALPYLRYRGNNANSSYLRMERQLEFLKSATAKVSEKTKADIRFPLTLFNTFSKNTTSNLTTDKVTFLSSCIFANRKDVDIEFKKIEGEQIIGEEGYAEFHPDETKLFELVLELFYIPLG